MLFKDKLKDLIGLFENWLSNPQDNVQLEQWIDDATIIADSFEFSDIEQRHVARIMEMYEEQFMLQIKQKTYKLDNNIRESMDELLGRKQTEQRTAEWYKQRSNVITASELGNLFASPYIRGKMVLSKITPAKYYNQSLTILSDMMSAFDWGIRFEPVVKQIYEYKYGTTIKELGRLIHPIDNRCSASPDGLVYSCPKNERIGRLIEIKCPVTREITGIIPKDYYAQVQMQLHVTGCGYCDYIEAQFSSKYNNDVQKEGPGLYNGFIALIRYKEIKNGQEFYYLYSPVNVNTEWIPEIKNGEEIVEIIPWRLIQWSEQTVIRSEEWWTHIKPIIDSFWNDVEKAKKGQFVIPESTRPTKRLREEKCMIIFNKLNEFGEEIKEKSLHV